MSTDEQFEIWCRRLKGSDRRAFEQVFGALHEALFRYALSLTGDRAAARDINQEAFVQLWEMRARLNPDKSLKALMYRMVRNRAYNHLRDRRHHARTHALLQKERPPRLAEADLPDAIVQARGFEAKLHEWMEELPARQREALLLSRYEDLSHAEVAAVMEISPNTVNNHIVHALKTLRDRIRAYQPDLLP